MRTRSWVWFVVAALSLVCLPASAVALTFVQPLGSPYPTTNPAFEPDSGGLLGLAASGDFNGDGISDVAVVNATGLPVFSAGESVSVLLGSRSGALTPAPDSPISIHSGGEFSFTGAIAAGDLNGDGELDLAVVDERHRTLSILLGDGTGRFHLSGNPIQLTGTGTTSITIGDFNDDNRPDIAVVDSDLNVLVGNGSGGFTPAPGTPTQLAGYPTSVAAGDFNHDGRSDLAIASETPDVPGGYVTIFLSNPEGSPHATGDPPLATDSYPMDIHAADLNGDGKLDLVTANSGSNNVTELLGDGLDDFTPASHSPIPVPVSPGTPEGCESGMPESVAIGDFNGDGKPDLAVAKWNGCNKGIAILLGNDTGEFSNGDGSPFEANGNPSPVVVGNFNADDKPDLAVVNSFLGRVTVLLNSPSIEPPKPPPSTGPTRPKEPVPHGWAKEPLPPPAWYGKPFKPWPDTPPFHFGSRKQADTPPFHASSKRHAKRCATRIVLRSRHGHTTKLRIRKCGVRRPHRAHKVRSAHR